MSYFSRKQMLAEPDTIEALTRDERVVLSFISGIYGPTTLTVGGEGAESVLCGRAARAMLSLIARGLVSAESFNNSGRVSYRPTEKARALRGQIPISYIQKYGRWSLTEAASA